MSQYRKKKHIYGEFIYKDNMLTIRDGPSTHVADPFSLSLSSIRPNDTFFLLGIFVSMVNVSRIRITADQPTVTIENRKKNI